LCSIVARALAALCYVEHKAEEQGASKRCAQDNAGVIHQHGLYIRMEGRCDAIAQAFGSNPRVGLIANLVGSGLGRAGLHGDSAD
jgi:hypothetical protein